ncbi:MAG: AAA family ATPase [Parabacteroides sp.]|nr:AAA family ATPase [Parabacteroides sp.]
MTQIGSFWHRWDLHIHTNASDGKGSCQEILDEAQKKHVSCIAVTDHHTIANIDEMKRLAVPMNINVISGVEFRTEYGQSSVHMIGLFPDQHNGVKLDTEFLNENILNPLGISRSVIIQKGKAQMGNSNLTDENYFKEGMFNVQVDFRTAANLIHKYGGLVTVHAGSKSNSIDEEMKHEGPAKKNVTIEDSLGPVKEELFRDGYIDICDLTKPKEAAFYLKKFGKPSITSSDAHEVNEVGNNACWIKADLTFEGLKQIIAEPERVSFTYPKLLDRLRKNPDKFIIGLEVKRTASATMQEVWFDNIHIDINPGLVAIIGNKGSGKSALTDILALCADSANQNWAFLTPNKFRMSRPYNRSKQIEASIGWADKSLSAIKTLDASTDTTQPERVKYIPQNFLETLCTTEDDREFEDELKKIIFQYLEPAQRYGKTDLDSIIDYLTKENSRSCQEIQSKIRDLNAKVIQLEEMLEPEYRTKLVNELNYKQDQLNNALSAKPKEVSKPNIAGDDEALKAKALIEGLQMRIESIDHDIKKTQQEKSQLSKSIHELNSTRERLDRLNNQVMEISNDISDLFKANDLDVDSIMKLGYHPEILQDRILQLQLIFNEREKQLDPSLEGSMPFQFNALCIELEKSKLQLSEPELKYQKYLKDKQEWEKSLDEITGTPEKEGTINYLLAKLDYIDNRLNSEVGVYISQRKELVGALMNKKEEVLNTYNALFHPIVKFISEYHDALKDYPIEFDAAFAIREFGEHFFDYVSQQSVGSYYGKEQGALRIKENIDNVNLAEIESIVNFACMINDDLLTDKRDGQSGHRVVEAQIKKGHTKQEVYDYIYGMDYVMPFFQLKMNGKSISSLSPGERGALLLLLYLFIDMDDKPLIIDQPEENLDNESVFKYLVQFVKVAKQKRQIIMVTHNPNLAVVCDADQIIQMKIDKLNGNAVTFESGAIENHQINKIIVNILEGTYPAFHNRDSKYFDKTI